jgi:2-oxoisovalerate dehydrogenase E2 component (dihydrolipoyl transacylase)
MARYEFRLPDVGEGVVEAELAAWHVKPGDRVKEDQMLVDIMTDKATLEITSPVAGSVISISGNPGEMLAVGSVLVEFELEGEAESVAEPVPASAPAPAPIAAASPLAAPATRARAKDLGIALEQVPGTGPDGRITDHDLDSFIARKTAAPAAKPQGQKRDGVTETKIIGLRRKIAEKMEDSYRRIPHITYVEEFDLTELEGLRRELDEERRETRPKLTLLPFFMRALAVLQPEFTFINARFDDQAGVLHAFDAVHIGIATQTSEGLMVPVVRHAEALDLWGCARELSRVTSAAKDGTATREELSGSTITITSLGSLGGIATTPIINAPEVAIIGPNKLVDRLFLQNGQITTRTMMNLSSSFDHRIVDGYDAARFVQRMRSFIERPARLFMDQA